MNEHDRSHDHHGNPDGTLADHVQEVAETLVADGHLTHDDFDMELAIQDAQGPALGAAVVARAWVDEGFHRQLLDDANVAVEDFGVKLRNSPRLRVVENTDSVHNMIVCTLCSCYPRDLLGLPPEWYKSSYYRSQAVRDPRSLLREFGLDIPKDVTVQVHDSTADLRYLVLPQRPAGTDGWSQDQLAELVTRDSMVGTGLPRLPEQ